MPRFTFASLQVAVSFSLLLLVANTGLAKDAPNIVVILADDFGVGDIQAHYPNNKIKTPCLDQLVREGMSFTDAHSPSAVCSPTRYGLLTGRYSWRTRMQEWVIAAYEPPLISSEISTLPQFLQEQGYHTACIGKWHLGWDWAGPQKPKMHPLERNFQKHMEFDFTKPIGGGPIDRGFDYYYGVVLPNMPPFCWIENDRVTQLPTEQYKLNPEQGHIVMPRGFQGCPMAPGWKFDNILPELTRRAVKHIHEQAKKDKPFFLYFPQTSPHEPVVPSAKFKGKSGIAPIADFVMETDWSAGQIIQAIDDAGIKDNTIVIFTADNGHSHYTGWKELVDAGHQPSGPFRGHKGDVWEGGHRVPLVVRWPENLDAGTSNDKMVCLTDIFATCANVLGVELDETVAVDSFSFIGKPNGQTLRTTMVNHSNFGEFAFRQDNWKLVYKLGGKNLKQSRGKKTIAELYDLSSDIAESKNVANQNPDMVAQLTDELSKLIANGTSRPQAVGKNDCKVRFETTQEFRWAQDAQTTGIKTIDLDDQAHRQIVVDREAGQYLGHPTTCLLEDNTTMLCVYPKGHGKGGIVYKRSTDGGLTWSDRLPTPKSWANSKEVPTLHRVIDANGKKRIIMWSGLYPAKLAVTEDNGNTWSELEKVGDWGGIVVMGFVEELKTGPGKYMAMFHDDGRFFSSEKTASQFTLYKTFSNDGGLSWSQPESVYQSSEHHLCEPGCIRSPDGKTLAVLLRENARKQNSHIIFSDDEGQTWTEPKELPLSLTGDRHTGKYAPDGRLFISFRCNSPKPKRNDREYEGDWVGWVGTWDDLVNGTEGQYSVRLKDNTKSYDTAYPGVEILPDGTFVVTTYGHWVEGESPYILSVRLKLTELDELSTQK